MTPTSTTSNSLESIVRQRRRHRSQCRNFNERNIKLASILTYIHVYVCVVRISMWECVHSSGTEPWIRGSGGRCAVAGIAHVIAINMFLPVVFPVFRHPYCRCRDDGETALYQAELSRDFD